MKIVSTAIVAVTSLLSSGVMAGSVQKITVPIEDFALHNNQIFVHRDGAWDCIGGVAPDGKGLFLSDSIPPCMARCSRIQIDASFKDFTLSTTWDIDPPNENSQRTDRYDPPDSRDHAERDHAEQDRTERDHQE